jgi:hypothetical protein
LRNASRTEQLGGDKIGRVAGIPMPRVGQSVAERPTPIGKIGAAAATATATMPLGTWTRPHGPVYRQRLTQAEEVGRDRGGARRTSVSTGPLAGG